MPDIQPTLDRIAAQVEAVASKHGRHYASAHEAYGVLAEEVQELFEEIRRQERSWARIEREAIDVAVVAVRLAAQAAAEKAGRR